LLHVIRAVREHTKPTERVLLVMSTMAIHAIDEWLKDGGPHATKFDQRRLGTKALRTIGQMFLVEPHGIKRVEGAKGPGIYLTDARTKLKDSVT
jgi:hypothetical protein